MVGLMNFLLPMAVLVAASVYYEIDLLLGALVASMFTMVLYFWQSLLSFGQLVDSMLDGFKVMLHPIAVVCAGFMLKDVNDQLGMTPYIIESLTPYLSKETAAGTGIRSDGRGGICDRFQLGCIRGVSANRYPDGTGAGYVHAADRRCPAVCVCIR